MAEMIYKSDGEWKQRLTPEQYRVMREKETETPFTGRYLNYHAAGIYRCAACGNALFCSDDKFDSGSGWPSFIAPLRPEQIREEEDLAFGMARTEIRCGQCGAHLGHVFDDGPAPTYSRYCINSVALDFKPTN